MNRFEVNGLNNGQDEDVFSDTFDEISNKDTESTIFRLKNSSMMVNARGESKISTINVPSTEFNQRLINRSSSSNLSNERSTNIIQGQGISLIGGDGNRGPGDGNSSNRNLCEFNQELMIIILRLEKSIENLSHKVFNLEKRKEDCVSKKNSDKNNWSSLPFSKFTLIFLLSYPVLIHFLISWLKRHRKK